MTHMNKDANALLLLGVYRLEILMNFVAYPFEAVTAGYESESSEVQCRKHFEK